MKIPNNGPWLAPGAKIIGPKKPAQNPIEPSRSAPRNVLATSPLGSPSSLRQTNLPTATAQTSETRPGIGVLPKGSS